MEIDTVSLAAFRTCAAICWSRRNELKLSEAEIEHVLIAWMKIGSNAEAEAATELLAARRDSERKQTKFDGLLGSDSAGANGSEDRR